MADGLWEGGEVEWEASQEWAAVMGDQGPWIRHVAAAWQAAATDAADRPTPVRPGLDAELDERIAYWAPLLHLLVFGLGWTRPDLGLAQWLERRRPLDEPILRVVDRWWGQEGVLDFLAWAASNGGVSFRLEPNLDFHSVAHPPQDRRFPDTPELERRRTTPDWQRTWGGGSDSMHLTHHIGSPLVFADDHNPTYLDERWVDDKDPHAIPRFWIVNDAYAGWYADFFHYFPSSSQSRGPNGRSVRVDIFVKPVGWLGEFRQHRKTRLWFRGRASVHVWGQ